MAQVIEHNIETLMEMHNECNEEEDNIIVAVVGNHVNYKLGHGFVNWNDNQKANILNQFKHLIAKQQQLEDEIERYYVTEIRGFQDLEIKFKLISDYIENLKVMYEKKPKWFETFQTNISHIRDILSTDPMLPIISRTLHRIRTYTSCTNA